MSVHREEDSQDGENGERMQHFSVVIPVSMVKRLRVEAIVAESSVPKVLRAALELYFAKDEKKETGKKVIKRH